MGIIKFRKCLSRLGAIGVGIIFLWSAIGKMVASGNFGELIASYGLEWFAILAPMIIIIELICAFCLILGIWQKQAIWVSLCMMVVFTLAYTYGNLVHGIEDCGCFGSYGLEIPVWLTYLRNLFMLVILGFLAYIPPKENERYTSQYKIIGGLLLIIASFTIGKTWRIPSYWATIILRPNPLVGQDINEGPIAKYATISRDSTYLIWVFSYECPACMNSIANIREYPSYEIADRFIPISVTEDKEGRMHKALNIPFDAPNAGNDLSGYIRNLPTLLYVERGKIKYIIEDMAPAAYFFKHFYILDDIE